MGIERGEAGLAAGLDDATRDACLHGLGDHYAAGRLSAEELDARIQLALAAESEEDLASVMTGLADELGDDVCDDQPSRPRRPESARPWLPRLQGPAVRWATATGILAAGSAGMAAAGPGPDAAEFAAGLAVGMLGFLTHWVLTTRSRERSSDDRSTGDVAAPHLPDAAPGPPPAGAGAPSPTGRLGPLDQPVVGRGPVPRRVRVNGGVIPSQRRGD